MSNLQGLQKVLKNFQELQGNIQKKHARKAGRKAMKSVQKTAKDNAKRIDDPKTAEKIHQNIVIRAGRSSNKNAVVTRVGVLGGAKAPAKAVGELQGKGRKNRGGDTFYWRFVEFGTARSKATPFMRPALQSNKQNVLDDFSEELTQQIYGDIK